MTRDGIVTGTVAERYGGGIITGTVASGIDAL